MATSLLIFNCCQASCCCRSSSPSPSPSSLLPLPLAPRKPAWWSPLSQCGTQDWSAMLSLADPPPSPTPSLLLCSSHAELLPRRENAPQEEIDPAAVAAHSKSEVAAPGEAMKLEEEEEEELPLQANPDENDDPARERRRFRLFTAEKARLLRHAMLESEAWRETMYHSAIASRLASSRP